MACGKRTQPSWQPPAEVTKPQLRLFNSLTRQKEIFRPVDGNRLTWYSCGPTVYDASHMGHARSYICFDILRRVLKDYFNYEVFYVMNITDIDDKIIQKARQDFLFTKYLKDIDGLSSKQIFQQIQEAIELFKAKMESTGDVDKKAMMEKNLNLLKNACDRLGKSSGDTEENSKLKLIIDNEGRMVISTWLDETEGKSVTENEIFSDLPKFWEEKFNEDMKALNVLPADVITRVSEYIPEIINFIEKIIEKGMAYESQSSVYFNTVAFDKSPNHFYAKLLPEAYGDVASLNEGEGVLSTHDSILQSKQNLSDFALWKASKPGEPSWPSPWGPGRPGWHIECSVMASDIIGSSLDIHSGGVDLKFPHHDNEIAQSEAYFGNNEWVRYFVHSGHLTISGCKMSKSLKNFITIKDALIDYTSTQIRLAFLKHSWKDTLDFSENTMEGAKKSEKTINEFFLNVKDISRNAKSIKWSQEDKEMNDKFFNYKAQIHEYLCDNIDTRSVMGAIQDLITDCNNYITKKRQNGIDVGATLLNTIARHITWLLQVFGVIEQEDSIGFKTSAAAGNVEDVVMPHVNALAKFREDVRLVAKTEKVSAILKLCDKLRDDDLIPLGVRLEDHEGLPTVVKLVDPETLKKEREERLKAEEETKRKKNETRLAKEAKDAARKIPPKDMFRLENQYSQFDEQGIPTHDANGKELSKGLTKRLIKQQQQQVKRYNDYLEEQNV